jgi:hypothetical protein
MSGKTTVNESFSMSRIHRFGALILFAALLWAQVSLAAGFSCNGPSQRLTNGLGIDQTTIDSSTVVIGKPMDGIGLNVSNLTIECGPRHGYVWLDNGRFENVRLKDCALVYEGCPVRLIHVIIDNSTIDVHASTSKAAALKAALNCGYPPAPDNRVLSCKDVGLVLP